MQTIKVLAVDDSAVVRRLLREVLSGDPAVHVAGVAANGKIALSMVEQLSPDILTLDIEMPEMDGLRTLAELRRRHPRLPVIMFSSLTERGAAATLEALTLGASDYVTKPATEAGFASAAQRIREQLLPRIKALCRTKTGQATEAIALRRAERQRRRIDIVAIGASTGGPNALGALLPLIPADFAAPIVIVQHMPPVFTRFFAERLAAASQVPVREAKGGELLLPGEAWLAPGDFHLTVTYDGARVRLATAQTPPENSCRPSVDVLFRSVAATYGGASLGVVMTGMGQDGLKGARQIHEAGGRVLVQDEATCVIWGMPGFIAQAGLADAILPLEQIAAEIIRQVNTSRTPQTVEVAASS
jgi:two-component system chemotaxis response regulator CheB